MEDWPIRDRAEINAEIEQKFNEFDSYRSQFEDQAIANYKLLIGFKDEENKVEGRSNLHIPKTYEIVDTLRARIVKNFFDRRPYIDFLPAPQLGNLDNLEQMENKADVASALVDDQLEKNNIRAKFYDYVTSMLTFPAGIMGVGWRYEEEYVKKKVPVPDMRINAMGQMVQAGYRTEIREEWVTQWDDNEITNIDFFDFWPDPQASTLKECRGVFQREWVTKEDLEQKLDFLNNLGEGVIYPVNLDELQGSNAGLEQGRWERLSAVGVNKGNNTFDIYGNAPDDSKQPFEVLHYWENDRHTMYINRQEVIYDGPTPYWRHKELPFIVQSYDRLPNEFYGKSAISLIHDLQHELNTQRNQRVDNVSMILNKMWKVRRGADIDEEELVSRPNGVIKVNQLDDVMSFEQGEIPQSALQSEHMVNQNLQNALGTTGVIRGADSKQDQTATEAMKKANSASLRFDVKIKLFDSTGIKRLARIMDLNNQQFINDNRLVKLGVDSTQNWKRVGPAELLGEFDYRPAGANVDPTANKQVRREQLTNMISMLMKTQNPYIDYESLTKEWLESFDMRNPEKFMKSEEQKKKEAIQKQRQAQQQGQGPRKQQNPRGTPQNQRRMSQKPQNPNPKPGGMPNG